MRQHVSISPRDDCLQPVLTLEVAEPNEGKDLRMEQNKTDQKTSRNRVTSKIFRIRIYR